MNIWEGQGRTTNVIGRQLKIGTNTKFEFKYWKIGDGQGRKSNLNSSPPESDAL